MPYEIIEHTADVGLRIWGKNSAEIFTESAKGLFELMTDLGPIREESDSEKADAFKIAYPFSIQAEDLSQLLFNWLRELLFVFSTQKLVFWDFRYEKLTDQALRVSAFGGRFDPDRHEQRYEVKAVTYHGFRLEKKNGGYSAEIIFDI